MAYADVVDAWKQYLANDNDGLRGQLLSALLIGTSVPAPGSPDAFSNVPPCEEATEPTPESDTAAAPTGCVVSFATFADTAPPPDGSLFGRLREGSGRAICTNPASLGSGASPLDSYFPAVEGLGTPWVRYQGLVTGQCTSDDSYDWLSITNTWTAADARPADLEGRITPVWGLHLIDMNLTLGDLVARQAEQVR